jgi:hypothetical protein
MSDGSDQEFEYEWGSEGGNEEPADDLAVEIQNNFDSA